MNSILGLDLGTNSIGWGLIGCNEYLTPTHLIDANSRIFQAMIEADTKVPKNKKRREKRSARTQISHFKIRRNQLLEILIQHQFLPSEFKEPSHWAVMLSQYGKLPEGQLKAFLLSNPIELRAKALSQDLGLHEIGRLLMHILRRRGYKSNRGIKYWPLYRYLKDNQIFQNKSNELQTEVEADDVDDETGKVLGGIGVLRNNMLPNETIAQFLVRKAQDEAWRLPRRLHTIKMDEVKIVARGKAKGQEKVTSYQLHANRELYEWEFYQIWDKQSANVCKLLNKTPDDIETLGKSIYQAIFDQRPLQLQKGKVGNCSIKPNKKRASAALLECQDYLLLQDVNNLQYSEVHVIRGHKQFDETNSVDLSPEQRQLLIKAVANPEYMDDKDRITWDAVRQIIGLDEKYKFNLEVSKNKDETGERIKSSKAGIKGNLTALAIARVIPEKWNQLSETSKKLLVNDLLNIHDKAALFNRLRNHYQLVRCPWNFTDQEAFDLCTLELPASYMGHCLDVINKLNTHLKEGKKYPEAMQLSEFQPAGMDKDNQFLDMPPNVANPIVQKALFELRRVFNAIVEKYGEKPKLIRIEMGRDMKASKKHREEMEKRNRENQTINEKIRKIMDEWNAKNSGLRLALNKSTLEKLKLWEEQHHQCLYSNNPERSNITLGNIANGDVDIDHIYPRSLSGMDDYLNKVLVFNSENLAKSQKTPWQAWGESEKYQLILKRANDWYGKTDSSLKAKLAKIKDPSDEQAFKEKMAEFTKAQLNDTRYICVAVRNYLKTLGYTDQEIQVSRGRATAETRRLWGLGDILPKTKLTEVDSDQSEVDNTAQEDGKAKKEKKKDRGDHRHHAIDAIVIALTDLSIYQELQKRYRYFELHGTWPRVKLNPPWPTLQQDVESLVLSRVVSFGTTRKISGELHDEMPYGLGFYEEVMTFKSLKSKPEIIRAMPDKTAGKTLNDSDTWIKDAGIRAFMQKWLIDFEKANKSKKFPPPILDDGKELEKITLAKRCFLKRISVVEALKRVENNPGKKTWVYNQAIRKILQDWLNAGHTIKSAEQSPPIMPSKNGNGNSIKSVRMASVSSSMVQFAQKPQVFAKSSNHHAVIFKRIVNGEVVERKGIFVDLLEAAKRIRKPPVVRKSPQDLLLDNPNINPAEWQYEMFLCNNDMVLWDTNDTDWISNNKKDLDMKNHHLPIYRLQKMTEGQLTFRHFSVTSSADIDNRGVIRRSPTKLRCKKIRMDALGNYTICND